MVVGGQLRPGASAGRTQPGHGGTNEFAGHRFRQLDLAVSPRAAHAGPPGPTGRPDRPLWTLDRPGWHAFGAPCRRLVRDAAHSWDPESMAPCSETGNGGWLSRRYP